MGKTRLESSLTSGNVPLEAAQVPTQLFQKTNRCAPETVAARSNSIKPITIFTAPKQFDGHIEVIQRNALKSWSMLSEIADVIVLGDEPGIRSVAREFRLRHVPDIRLTEQGTPRIDSLFERAREHTLSPWMMFANADLILNNSLVDLFHRLEIEELRECLIIGRRVDFEQTHSIDFRQTWESGVRTQIQQTGKYASLLCKDYFLFPRHLFRDVPAFAIGRGNWDSWMVAHAKNNGWPVIDATNLLLAAHQNHDHGHVGNKRSAYVDGVEAKFNRDLAGGTNYLRGSLATHRFGRNQGLQRINRFPLLSMALDLPSLISLARSVI